MHSSHRRAHDQSEMIHSESVGQQSILRFDHVEVTIMRQFCVHPIAWLTRFSVTDPVGQDDEKFRRVEWLIFSKKFARELRPDELRSAPGCPVQDQHRVRRFALGIFIHLAKRAIMNPQFRQRLAGSKSEIADYVISFCRRGIIRCA